MQDTRNMMTRNFSTDIKSKYTLPKKIQIKKLALYGDHQN